MRYHRWDAKDPITVTGGRLKEPVIGIEAAMENLGHKCRSIDQRREGADEQHA
jgi:hypothetical protein